MTRPLPGSVILSEAADHEVIVSAVEGPRACVQPHGPRTEFSLGPELVILR
jgi:hypothetical protein